MAAQHLKSDNYVPTARLREAFLASGMEARDVARNLGWMINRKYEPWPVADGPRVRRALGMRLDTSSHGKPPRFREAMSYDLAVRMAEAIGVDPWEVGL